MPERLKYLYFAINYHLSLTIYIWNLFKYNSLDLTHESFLLTYEDIIENDIIAATVIETTVYNIIISHCLKRDHIKDHIM